MSPVRSTVSVRVPGSVGRAGRGRGYFLVYMMVALFFLVLEAIGQSIPHQVRAYANDVVTPILSLLERPITATQAGLERLAGVGDIYTENQTLREENERLKQWQEAARQLMRENDQLRSILKGPSREVPTAATGRVIGMGGGAFERSVIVNLGSNDGVKRDLPVVDDAGVVGRVIHVGLLSSRVLLVNDLNSRIPVRVERTGALAVAEGQNEPLLKLNFLPKRSTIRVGDRVLTSGHGANFPPDLPVGRVVSISGDVILMEPLGLTQRLDYVRVLDYQAVIPEDTPESAVAPNQIGGGNQ